MNTLPAAHSYPPLYFSVAQSVFSLLYCCSSSPLRAGSTPVTLHCLRHSELTSPSLHPHNMGLRRLLFGFCIFFCLYGSVLATTCKLKAKFNLSGYKNTNKKKVVIGGMFPVHKHIASSAGNTSKVPTSSGCEGWVDPSITIDNLCAVWFFF